MKKKKKNRGKNEFIESIKYRCAEWTYNGKKS